MHISKNVGQCDCHIQICIYVWRMFKTVNRLRMEPFSLCQEELMHQKLMNCNHVIIPTPLADKAHYSTWTIKGQHPVLSNCLMENAPAFLKYCNETKHLCYRSNWDVPFLGNSTICQELIIWTISNYICCPEKNACGTKSSTSQILRVHLLDQPRRWKSLGAEFISKL